jgi:hypothetical protein
MMVSSSTAEQQHKQDFCWQKQLQKIATFVAAGQAGTQPCH